MTTMKYSIFLPEETDVDFTVVGPLPREGESIWINDSHTVSRDDLREKGVGHSYIVRKIVYGVEMRLDEHGQLEGIVNHTPSVFVEKDHGFKKRKYFPRKRKF